MKQELARFAAAGAAGFVVDAAVLYLGLWVGLGYFLGRLISFMLAVATTWLINRTYTFRVARSRSLLAEFLHYLAAMAVGGAVNYAAYTVAILWLPRAAWAPLVAVAVGVAAGMAINYTSARFWVFRAGKERPGS